MGISCDGGEYDGDGWYWESNYEYRPLNTKRSRKCCSCEERIAIGDSVMTVWRNRSPQSDIEERIHGDEVPLATWYLCEKCGDLALSLNELNMCFTLGEDSIKKQIADYREAEAEYVRRFNVKPTAKELSAEM